MLRVTKTFVFFYIVVYLELPSILPLSFSTEASNENDYNQLSCIVTKGDLPITFFWSLNDESISNGLATTINVGRQTR